MIGDALRHCGTSKLMLNEGMRLDLSVYITVSLPLLCVISQCADCIGMCKKFMPRDRKSVV